MYKLKVLIYKQNN